MPGPQKVHDTPCTPFLCHLIDFYRTLGLLFTVRTEPTFECDYERAVHPSTIGTAKNNLCHMFGHGDAAADQKGDLIADRVTDQVKMDLTHQSSDMFFLVLSKAPSIRVGLEVDDVCPTINEFTGPSFRPFI